MLPCVYINDKSRAVSHLSRRRYFSACASNSSLHHLVCHRIIPSHTTPNRNFQMSAQFSRAFIRVQTCIPMKILISHGYPFTGPAHVSNIVGLMMAGIIDYPSPKRKVPCCDNLFNLVLTLILFGLDTRQTIDRCNKRLSGWHS